MNIQPYELRIGNIVALVDGPLRRFAQVCEISLEKFCCFDHASGRRCWSDQADMVPIRLTEKIIGLLGFENTQGHSAYHKRLSERTSNGQANVFLVAWCCNGLFTGLDFVMNADDGIKVDYSFRGDMDYLHNFQNVYADLTHTNIDVAALILRVEC